MRKMAIEVIKEENEVDMRSKLVELKSLMVAQEKLNCEYKEKQEAFEKQVEGIKEKMSSVSEKMNEAKESIKSESLEAYMTDGEKKRLGGIGIQVRTDIEFDDAKAFSWAKEHSLCLKLDSGAFKKIAKTQDIDFVEKSERVLVTFPKEIKLE